MPPGHSNDLQMPPCWRCLPIDAQVHHKSSSKLAIYSWHHLNGMRRPHNSPGEHQRPSSLLQVAFLVVSGYHRRVSLPLSCAIAKSSPDHKPEMERERATSSPPSTPTPSPQLLPQMLKRGNWQKVRENERPMRSND